MGKYVKNIMICWLFYGFYLREMGDILFKK